MITKSHYESSKLSHKERDIINIIKTTNQQLVESKIDKLVNECLNLALSEVRVLLKNQYVESVEVTHHMVAPPLTTITDVRTTASPPLPDLLCMPPDLVLRNDVHVLPQPVLIEPTTKAQSCLNVKQDGESPQFEHTHELIEDDSRNEVNLAQDVIQIKLRDDQQSMKFLTSILEEAWFSAMRQVCVCSRTRLIRTLLIRHFRLVRRGNLKTLKPLPLTPMLN